MLLCACACATRRALLVTPQKLTAGARAPATFITSVRVFDGEADHLLGPFDVLLDDGRIAAVTDPGTTQPPAGAERVDGKGKTLLPGLIDCHVHVGGGDGLPPWAGGIPNTDAQAAAMIYSGVTSALEAVRDANPDLIDQIARGEKAGPRLVFASRAFTAPGGHPVGLYKAVVPWPAAGYIVDERVAQVATPEDARNQVEKDLRDPRIRFVKLMADSLPPGAPELAPEVLKAAIDETRLLGRRAIVHASDPAEAIAALEAGASALMHVPWGRAFTRDEVQKLRATGAPVVTTVRFPGALTEGMHGVPELSPLERAVMPEGYEKAFREQPAHYNIPGFPESYLKDIPKMNELIRANLKVLYEAGVPLLAGTDSGVPAMLHGAALHRELQTLVQLGIPAWKALRMATSEAAHFLQPAADYGRIGRGMRADLLLVEGDPLADITNTQRIVAVWQDGRKVQRKK